MKTKILFWSAVIFLALGLSAKDGILYYFFAIHLCMLLVGVWLHKISYTPQPKANAEPLPKAES
jgi:membrane protein insertase Oxa1/YidC/SpoIIIJ